MVFSSLPVDVDAPTELFLDTGFLNFLVLDNGDGADGADADADADTDADADADADGAEDV
ncbi:hypothetical protein DICPUDRAFT_159179 [Dictyostelium purpureum]|uniref:Uncharacterized protein n=1 Tax=Dictyostelium purpureum TaxID=5786 RepID=F1A3G9_DICPU|nr:uncharacterized protein DICPUDRAFT_159179 [Dictyostelium purpureum]EGC29264.1 hypothetical protein DICPUDRAFT_159179 [Dictyostelium purpureum]|eukprot:XP_003294217.1 hypothetical protein DICPUDRAFT_159179 [Dictyostelium purpureum]